MASSMESEMDINYAVQIPASIIKFESYQP